MPMSSPHATVARIDSISLMAGGYSNREIAHALGTDLAEPDWWRVLDALLLIATHPAGQ